MGRLNVSRDRQEIKDRNLPDSWKEDLDFHYQCKHYLYEHRPIFYGIQMNGEWKFGVKDFSSKNEGVEINIFPHPVIYCNQYKLSEIFEDPGEMIEIIDLKEDLN